MLCLRFAAFIVSWWTANAGLTFLTIGDWGGAALEEPSQPWAKNTAAVAKQLGKSVADKNVKFIVNTGDNFYWCGLQNSSDFQVAKDSGEHPRAFWLLTQESCKMTSAGIGLKAFIRMRVMFTCPVCRH